MAQIRLLPNVFVPMPVTLVGCTLKGRANFMAAGWVCRVNAEPPWIGVGIARSRATPAGILAHGAFSICFPRPEHLVKTDYCGIVSGREHDKSAVFTVFEGELADAPLIAEASVNLQCELVQTVDGPTNHFFIGEIKAAYADPDCLTDGYPDPGKCGFLLHTLPDSSYYAFGPRLGDAGRIGEALRPRS
ncbi:MAG: flavin reductase family protein [Lentisphaeria bacterium]|nr:flavin reductase family protein [Lentisphaeria bacterium]